jgi:hypothetical protein
MESRDNPYSFKEVEKSPELGHGDSASYAFDADGHKLLVDVRHYTQGEAEVSFEPFHDDRKSHVYKMTGDKGTKAARIMSTVHHIIKHHVGNRPHVQTIDFTSDKTEPSRASVYTRYTKQMGGRTIDLGHEHRHVIQADAYR